VAILREQVTGAERGRTGRCGEAGGPHALKHVSRRTLERLLGARTEVPAVEAAAAARTLLLYQRVPVSKPTKKLCKWTGSNWATCSWTSYCTAGDSSAGEYLQHAVGVDIATAGGGGAADGALPEGQPESFDQLTADASRSAFGKRTRTRLPLAQRVALGVLPPTKIAMSRSRALREDDNAWWSEELDARAEAGGLPAYDTNQEQEVLRELYRLWAHYPELFFKP